MNLKKTLAEYYSKRAKEYEEVYHRPDKTRLKEQRFLSEYITQTFKEKYVLELACGTGFWTRYLLKSARKTLVTDYSMDMLEIASNRFSKNQNVIFLQADAYNPPISFPKFNAAMANFWFSHIPKGQIRSFLNTLHSRLEKNSVILLSDGVYVEELGGKLITKQNSLDTFKKRVLNSGEQFDILKNYYTENDLRKIFTRYSRKVEIKYLTNFWIVKYYI